MSTNPESRSLCLPMPARCGAVFCADDQYLRERMADGIADRAELTGGVVYPILDQAQRLGIVDGGLFLELIAA